MLTAVLDFSAVHPTLEPPPFQAMKTAHAGFVTALANYNTRDDSTIDGKWSQRFPKSIVPPSRAVADLVEFQQNEVL